MITNCLTYNQLQAYSKHSMNDFESEQFYQHISVCELCSCAVNGFSAISFSSDELVAIHREIDAKANAAATNPLTIARVFIAVVSLFSIFGVYALTNHPIEKTVVKNAPIEKVSINLTSKKNETKAKSQKEIPAATKKYKKGVAAFEYKKFERMIVPMEVLNPIKTEQICLNANVIKDDAVESIVPKYNSNVIYLYDLKIAEYAKLYFSRPAFEVDMSEKHTPVYKENVDSKTDDFGFEQHAVSADSVLKNGLKSFNKQQYSNALTNFNLLLANNPNDLNALFYAGLSHYNLGNLTLSKQALFSVMEARNNTFYQEAQWYFVLASLKNGDKMIAKQHLEIIVDEKGFYSKRAKLKLKSL